MEPAINSLISAIIGGGVVALVNFLLKKRERQYFEEIKYRRKSYTDLLNNVQGFLDDPNVSDEEKRSLLFYPYSAFHSRYLPAGA